jgi:hypothetical protein
MSDATMLEIVMIPPPPHPAIVLAAISIGMLCASPHRSVPIVKRVRAIREAARRPMMSDSFPYRGVVVAMASR